MSLEEAVIGPWEALQSLGLLDDDGGRLVASDVILRRLSALGVEGEGMWSHFDGGTGSNGVIN